MLDIIIDGQKKMLDIAQATSAQCFLFLSSGAVYGRQPMDLDGLPEDWDGAPKIEDPQNAYHEGKRVAELMGNLYASASELRFVSARLFAFLAPFLPLTDHFAAGNFIGDILAGRNITIQSGGGSVRSYQYGTDMSVWLLAVLARGLSGRAYNIGSDEAVTIRKLAETIALEDGNVTRVEVKGTNSAENVNRYVPDVSRSESELDLQNQVTLVDSINRTLNWARGSALTLGS
jgi:dTDP-glucose 4,6-dehydratase